MPSSEARRLEAAARGRGQVAWAMAHESLSTKGLTGRLSGIVLKLRPYALNSAGILGVYRPDFGGELVLKAVGLMERELKKLGLARQVQWLERPAPAGTGGPAPSPYRGKLKFGFMPRFLVSTTLPHRPVKEPHYKRRDGHFELTMTAPEPGALPYGVYGRLVIVHLATAARVTGSRRIRLGDSHRQWEASANVTPSGGRRGGHSRWMDQVWRVAGTSWVYRNDRHTEGGAFHVIDRWQKTPGPVVDLSARFFSHALAAPPLSLDTLEALRPASLAMDVYTWLSARTYALKKDTVVNWWALREQFGSGYADGRDFRKKMRKALGRVRQEWPGMPAHPVERGIYLRPRDAAARPRRSPGRCRA